jgi:hypothetical protein
LIRFQTPLYRSSLLSSGFQPGSRGRINSACGSRHGINSICQLVQNLVDCCLFLPLLFLAPAAAAACPAACLLLLLLYTAAPAGGAAAVCSCPPRRIKWAKQWRAERQAGLHGRRSHRAYYWQNMCLCGEHKSVQWQQPPLPLLPAAVTPGAAAANSSAAAAAAVMLHLLLAWPLLLRLP